MNRSRGIGIGVAGAGVIAAAATAAYLGVVRPWHRRWGATDDDVQRTMPGDDLVDNANFCTTRAISIQARASQIWPWLVQLGQGRGGFYSYDLLENTMGLDIRSAGQIVPELQDLQVGDTIPLEPEGGGYRVAEIEPNRYLVLFTEGEGDSDMDQVFRQADAASTWTFLLQEQDGAGTRLIVRWRARWDLTGSVASFLIGVMLDPIEFLMEQKMMRGIKERAEASTKAGA